MRWIKITGAAHHSKPLAKIFGEARVNKITEGMIRDYIAERHRAGRANAKVNKELAILIGILRRAKRWHLFSEDIRRLKAGRSRVGRVLGHDEKLRLLRASKANPEWQRARLAMLLALNTTMRAGEIRNLQWRDVDWIERMVCVRRGKTDESQRDIPMNREAYDAILLLREQAKVVFGDDLAPDWYVFFAERVGEDADATRPVRTWRTAWRSLTRAVQCPDCGVFQKPGARCSNEKCEADIHELRSPLRGLRFHDLRHQAITELSEGQASDETVMSIAGHIDRRMMSHYSHIRKQARRTALDRLCDGSAERNSRGDTAQSTAQSHQLTAVPFFQVIEKNGGDDETRTRDLCRDRAAF